MNFWHHCFARTVEHNQSANQAPSHAMLHYLTTIVSNRNTEAEDMHWTSVPWHCSCLPWQQLQSFQLHSCLRQVQQCQFKQYSASASQSTHTAAAEASSNTLATTSPPQLITASAWCYAAPTSKQCHLICQANTQYQQHPSRPYRCMFLELVKSSRMSALSLVLKRHQANAL